MGSEKYSLALLFIFVISVGLIVFEEGNIHGRATQFATPTNVTIQKSLAISFSPYLAEGIIFEDVNLLPAVNVNAEYNYVGEENGTGYYVLVSPDGNIDVDLCIKATGDLMSEAGDVIGLGNETYSSSLITNSSFPELNETSLTLSYIQVGETIPVGNSSYMRFWLDVPAGQAAGTYNNSVYLKGSSVGVGC